MTEETIWLMDSEFCCDCGCILEDAETNICWFCLHEKRTEEEQHCYYLGDDEEEAPTIGTPEEAYAVAFSLTDEEIERLESEEPTP